jgi:hypothetical protein
MPDDAELIKAGTQGLVQGTLAPFHELIMLLLGPAAEEAGFMLRESVARFRASRTSRFFGVTSEKIHAAGIEPRPVALKLLMPIVESASLEDDDELQDIWANLLANATDRRDYAPVAPSFPNVLRNLSAQEVKFLDALYTHARSEEVIMRFGEEIEKAVFERFDVMEVYSKAGLSRCTDLAHDSIGVGEYREDVKADMRDLDFVIDVVTRDLLLNTWFHQPTVVTDVATFTRFYAFTTLGARFILACKVPRK